MTQPVVSGFRQRVRNADRLLGTIVTLPSPEVAEVLTGAGFDWLFIDMEHGLIDAAAAQRIVQAVAGRCACVIRVPTHDAAWIGKALDAGADIINDISGLKHNDDLARLVARRRVPIVLMHMRGTPKTMQKQASYRNTISEILRELQPSIAAALGAGIPPEMIIVDPGVGFGKRAQDNLRIIRELASLKSLNFPILVGLSRKSFIGEILDRPVEKRLIGTVTANTLAIINGANIIRVHDVADAVEMVKVIDSVRRFGA